MLVALIIWMHFEIHHVAIKVLAQDSKLAHYLVKAWLSNWPCAIAICGVNMGIPLMAVLHGSRQCVRRFEGVTTSQDEYTGQGRRLVDALDTWNWCNTFVTVNVGGQVIFVPVVGLKLPYVLFLFRLLWVRLAWRLPDRQ